MSGESHGKTEGADHWRVAVELLAKLIKMPGTVEAAAITPVQSVGVPRLSEKGFKTGFLDIVELRIAKKPMTQSIKNTLLLTFFSIRNIDDPQSHIKILSHLKFKVLFFWYWRFQF